MRNHTVRVAWNSQKYCKMHAPLDLARPSEVPVVNGRRFALPVKNTNATETLREGVIISKFESTYVSGTKIGSLHDLYQISSILYHGLI